MSASETPKSRLETRSFPPVSTPAPPLPAAPLNPLKPLSNMSCCHLSGSCLGCNRRKRTHLLTSGSPCLCQSQSTRLGAGASRGSTSKRARVLNSPQEGPPCSLPTPSLQASESVQTKGVRRTRDNMEVYKWFLCKHYIQFQAFFLSLLYRDCLHLQRTYKTEQSCLH